jgi:hypothetical protein
MSGKQIPKLGDGVLTTTPAPGAPATDVNLAEVAGTATTVGAGAVGAGTQRTTLAGDDPAVTLLTGIDVDTDSIDGKTPALGTGVMAGSVPATIATDDTQFGAVGAAADVDGNIHGQLRYSGETIEAARVLLAAIEADTDTITSWTATHDTIAGPFGPQGISQAKAFTGSAFPNAVGTANDAVRTTASLNGVQYNMLVNADGSKTPIDQTTGAMLGEDINKPNVTIATGSGAISTTTAIADDFEFDHLTLHLDGAGTTAENLTVTLNANDDPAYDTILYSIDLSVGSITDLVIGLDDLGISARRFEAGDELVVAWPNSEGNTYGLRIVAKVI